jgi:plasmid stabilization system protein ParE
MPLRLKIRRRARQDVLDIIEYIATRNGDYVVARQFAQRLLDRCYELTKAPGAGSPSALLSGMRKINEGAYKIYYRKDDGTIVILRIWDGRRGQEPRLPR